MATKLKGLRVKKVDFVDNGANPDAHVVLFKRAGDKLDSGAESIASIKNIGAQISKALLAGIHDGGSPDVSASEVAKKVLSDALAQIEKTGAVTFDDGMRERRTDRIRDEMWDICFALNKSLCSIINDDEVTNAAELMQESLSQFTETMTASIKQWAAGNTINAVNKSADAPTDEDVQIARECRKRLDDILAMAAGREDNIETNAGNGDESKGENFMNIDKSQMTPAERAFFEDLEKRYAVPEDNTQEGSAAPTQTQNAPTASVPAVEKSAPSGTEDIYADLHPAVAAELKALKKRADEADNKELAEIAKKYEIIGKKPEDLVPVLKSLRAAGGTAYDEMISILDASVEAVNKSGMFAEIGKSGGYGTEPDAWTQIEKKADEIAAANPKLSRASAIDLACQQNPQLVHEYENGR